MGNKLNSKPVSASSTSISVHARVKYGLRVLLALIMLFSFFIQTETVHAVSYNVPCNTSSLIGSIVAANATLTDDTLNLAAGCTYTLTLVNNLIFGPNGLPAIEAATTAGKLTILGNGATISRSSAVGTSDFRFFQVLTGGDLTLDNLTLENGYLQDEAEGSNANGAAISNSGTVKLINTTVNDNAAIFAGGVANSGSLTLIDSTFTNNKTTRDGAGINSGPTGATLVVSGSTFSGNIAQGLGGGILVGNGGTAAVTDTTFSGNSAFQAAGGAGMLVVSATATITRCTFNGNYAEGAGGGLFVGGTGGSAVVDSSTFFNNSAYNGGALWNNLSTLTVTNSTVKGNSAGNLGGGIYIESGIVNLGSTIIAGNSATNSGPDISGAVNSTGYNLIGNTAGASITGTTTGNLTDSEAAPLNLGPLHNNGGSTQTMALLPGSVAIDAGTTSGCPTFDQRGYRRPIGLACDIGAFEYGFEAFLPLVIR